MFKKEEEIVNKRPFYLLLGFFLPLLLLSGMRPAPDVPKGLIAPPESATPGSVTLLWDKPDQYSEVESYVIFQNGVQVAESGITNYTVQDLKYDKSYLFYVKSKLKSGKLSKASKKLLVETKKAGETFNINDFGAKGDGRTLNTEAIQRAIDTCTPGGMVYVPEGIYLTGALFLKSDMTLYLEKGATLQGTADPEDYLPMIKNRFEGWEMETYASLLNAGDIGGERGYRVKHLSIRGEGTISGGGEPLAKAMIEEKGIRSRGRLILLMKAQFVDIQGLKIKNSPAWGIHYIYSNGVSLHDLDIESNVRNGDGIDPDSSTDSYIFNCTFSTDDDCIAIKSGKNPEGFYLNMPTTNVWISNCNFIKGHSIAIGSEMSGGVGKVLVRDCVTGNLIHGFQIKGTKERGGYVRDVAVRDCDLKKITIFSSVGYNNDGEAAPEVPVFRNFTFSNIDMRAAEKEPVIIVQGFDDEAHYTHDILFEDIRLPNGAEIELSHSKDVAFRNVLMKNGEKPKYKMEHTLDIDK